MAINKDSNAFTFLFASVMVIIVGGILALLATSLKPLQTENKNQEKKKNILMSVGVMSKDDDMAEANDLFNEYVTNQVLIDASGKQVEGDAFGVDVLKQFRSLGANAIDSADARFPLYECSVDGTTYYVVPMAGKGLWGPIWGFVALEKDMNTIYGATFDHKTETPGLGAEINTTDFQDQFPGMKINNGSKYVYIKVHKGGGGETDPYGVDGITGGTITSVGLQNMISNTLSIYAPYFDNQKS